MSFPVIHEMLGEYSPLFYALKDELFAAPGREALATFEKKLKAQGKALSERECQKLRLLTARRWKVA
jgi:hypothetical protein